MFPTVKQLPRFFPHWTQHTPGSGPARLALGAVLERVGLAAILLLDRLLRGWLRIDEFSQSPECVLRASKTYAASALTLPDGTAIEQGEPLLELHLWNERLKESAGTAYGLGWEMRLLKRIRASLMLLAESMEQEPSWVECRIVHARFVGSLHKSDHAVRYLGFMPMPLPCSLGTRIHDFFEDFLVFSLIWAFHPGGARLKRRELKRTELWLTKEHLLAMHALYEANLAANSAPGCRVCSDHPPEAALETTH